MQQQDPSRRRKEFSDNNKVVLGILVAALIVVGFFVFWPQGDTRTGWAMRDDSPRTQRAPATTPSPQPDPAKPAQ